MSDTNPLRQLTQDANWNAGKRVRENVSMTAKGEAQIEVTVEYLNQDTSKFQNNPQDLADLTELSLEDEIVKRVELLTQKLNEKGIRCTHQKES